MSLKKSLRSLDIHARRAKIFETGVGSLSHRIDNFPKFARRQKITRFLALYELFKMVLNTKGSIIECGVNSGFSLFTWAHLSSILEPNNISRMIYGFDSFSGFTALSEKDTSIRHSPNEGDMSSDSYDELNKLIEIYDDNRFLGNITKVKLVKGDLNKTAPEFIKDNQHLIVSLLFIDVDLYEPTKTALDVFLPRIPKGGIVVFDEVDHPQWPGETLALLEKIDIKDKELNRLSFDPYLSYVII